MNYLPAFYTFRRTNKIDIPHMDPIGTGELPNDMGIGWVSNWLRGAKSANPMASSPPGLDKAKSLLEAKLWQDPHVSSKF